jgi:hypothetical protein
MARSPSNPVKMGVGGVEEIPCVVVCVSARVMVHEPCVLKVMCADRGAN